MARLGDRICALAHPRQRDFVLDPSNTICALVGRGGGKTTGAMFRFVRRMLTTPNANCLFIATTRDQAEKLLWIPLKALCEKYDIAARFWEDRLRCVFLHNGATLQLADASDKKSIEKYRGIPHHEVWIDECGSYPAKLLKTLKEDIIEPRLGDYNGTIGLIGTPGHTMLGPFYDLTRPGAEDSWRYDARDEVPEGWVGWSFHDWTLLDAVAAGIPAAKGLWKNALEKKAKNKWSDDHPTWQREYLGRWSRSDADRVYRYRPHDDDGKPWNQWNPARRPSGLAVLPENKANDWCFVYGMDFGTKDPFALEVFAYSPSDPEHHLWHVFEFIKRGEMYARNVARLLVGDALDVEKPAGIVGETGWPDGIAGDGSAQTLIDELLNVYGIKVEPAPRKQGDKLDSIELFNGDLQDGRLHVLKGSELETQLSELQWVIDENGERKEDKGARNDAADAAIYARRIARHLVSAVVEEKAPYFPARTSDPTKLPWETPKDDGLPGLYDAPGFDDW